MIANGTPLDMRPKEKEDVNNYTTFNNKQNTYYVVNCVVSYERLHHDKM